jgi:hypothetical protein
MKGKNLVLKLVAVGLLAVTAMAGSSFAQSPSDVFTGSFTLPFEAHWGTVDLKPGTYSFSVTNENGLNLVRLKRNDQPIGFVLASSFDARADDLSSGGLLCAHHDGSNVIAALDMPWNGVYHFYVPRGTNPKFHDLSQSILLIPSGIAKISGRGYWERPQ